MATKQELAEAAKEIVAKERAFKAETEQQPLAVRAGGVHALATMSDEDFETRLIEMKQGQQRMARVQREYMTEGVDYGNIEGIDKPTIFKPGAEKLMQLYGLVARVESEFTAGDNAATPPLTYDSQCFLHVGSFDGPIVGVGHGTANAWEKRYRREGQKTCPNCGKTAIIKGKAEYGGGWLCWAKKGGCGTKYANDDPAIIGQESTLSDGVAAYDLGVTLLKMSEKRSITDAVLRATATSGLFTQDVAEEPPETAPVGAPDEPRAEPTVTVVTSQPAAAPEPSGEATAPIAEGLTPDQFDQVVATTGGEEIVVGPSAVEGVERGGKTSGANEAQIAEVRRLAGELHWGAKRLLKHIGDDVLDADLVIPEDAAAAKTKAEETLDALSADQIGYFLQVMRASIEEKEAPQVTM